MYGDVWGQVKMPNAGLYEEKQSPVYCQWSTFEIGLVQKKQRIYIIIYKLNN